MGLSATRFQWLAQQIEHIERWIREHEPEKMKNTSVAEAAVSIMESRHREYTEADLQLTLLALALLSLYRPGMEYAAREIAKGFNREPMFDGFRKANEDIIPDCEARRMRTVVNDAIERGILEGPMQSGVDVGEADRTVVSAPPDETCGVCGSPAKQVAFFERHGKRLAVPLCEKEQCGEAAKKELALTHSYIETLAIATPSLPDDIREHVSPTTEIKDAGCAPCEEKGRHDV